MPDLDADTPACFGQVDCLSRVMQQVEYDLLNLGKVDVHAWQSFFTLQINHDL